MLSYITGEATQPDTSAPKFVADTRILIIINMAAASGDGNQPQQVSGEDVPEGQLPPSAGGLGFEQQSTPDRRNEKTLERPPARSSRSNRSRRPVSSVALMGACVLRLSVRVMGLCRRMVDRPLQWFTARPLGQRALEAVCHTIATVEKVSLWAASATDQAADRPVPFAWYLMIPIIMALMVIRTGADLAETYLDIQLPENRQLVNWLERQRIHLEQLQAVAAGNARPVCVDENQPSDSSTESSVPTPEPATSSASSTVTEAEEHEVHNSRGLAPLPDIGDKSLHFTSEGETQTKQSDTEEQQQDDKREEVKGQKAPEEKLTSPPETAGDRSFSPDGERQKEESETKEQQDEKQEPVEGEKVEKQKTEEPPTISEEEAIRAAMAVVSPEPSVPPEQLVLEEAERAVIGVVPPPPSQTSPTSENLLDAARTSRSEPGTSSTAQKAASKASRTSFFSRFGTKSSQNRT